MKHNFEKMSAGKAQEMIFGKSKKDSIFTPKTYMESSFGNEEEEKDLLSFLEEVGLEDDVDFFEEIIGDSELTKKEKIEDLIHYIENVYSEEEVSKSAKKKIVAFLEEEVAEDVPPADNATPETPEEQPEEEKSTSLDDVDLKEVSTEDKLSFIQNIIDSIEDEEFGDFMDSLMNVIDEYKDKEKKEKSEDKEEDESTENSEENKEDKSVI